MTDLLGLLPFSSFAAAGLSLLVTLLVLVTLPWHGHLSLDSTFGVQRNHSRPTPRVGGIGVVAGVLAGCLLAQPQRQSLLWPLLLAGLPAFVFGLTEDLTKRVSVRARLLATLACGALGYAMTGYSITHVNVMGFDWLLGFSFFSVAFTAFAVGGVANAINIIDGMNGLASGSVIIVLVSFAWLCHALGDLDLTLSCLILGGAVVGFMLVNWPLGKIFLGDGGAYFLGVSVAWLAVLLLARHPEVSAWSPLLVCGLPILEVLFSILRRWRRRQKIGAPDCLHLHSLINRRLTRRLLPHASPLARNSATGAVMCCSEILPAYIALHWAGDTLLLVLAFALSALLYSAVYARLTQFRWCIGALTLRDPVDVGA